MRRIGVALFSLCLSLAWPGLAQAVLTPSGTTLWNVTAGTYSMRIETFPSSALGTMTITNSLSGLSAVGNLYPAAVIDRPHGELDELIVDAFFSHTSFYPMLGLGPAPGGIPYQAQVHIGLGDLDGVAFDGALPGFGGQFLIPIDPPPLSLFELNVVVLTHTEIIPPQGYTPVTQELTLSSVPEPSLWALLTPLVFAALAARRALRGA